MSLFIITGSFFSIFAGYFVYSYLKFRFHSKYEWKRLNVPYIEPTFLFGNTLKAIFFEPIWETLSKIYLANRDVPLLGLWLYNVPVLAVQDVNLVKNILVSDFECFQERGLLFPEEGDPLKDHLVGTSGAKWEKIRAKLSPIFTSGKIKNAFPLIAKYGKELQDILKGPAGKEETVEWKDLLCRFTSDATASYFFGVETNSLKNPTGDFIKYEKKALFPGILFTIHWFLANYLKFLPKIFPCNGRPKDVNDFFLKSTREIMEYREKYNINRDDLMDLIIELKNEGKGENADDKYSKDVSATEITFEIAAAQVYSFALGGFITPSTVMTFTLYELARNVEIQKRLQDEIDRVLAKHNNEISYEAVQEMEYLDCIIHETTRIYPSAPLIPRTCTKDYTFPGTDVTIKKGTSITIPVFGIQNDPQYFPDPEKFDPDRFTAEEKSKRDKFLHLPFGEGPRMCIAKQLVLTLIKTGLIFVLEKYNVEISEKTKIPVKMDPTLTTTIAPNNKGVNLKISTKKKS